MSEISIFIDANSFCMRDSEITSGCIYFILNEAPFPSDTWSDAPILILSWWIEEYLNLKNDQPCEFSMMEGPYSLKVESTTDVTIVKTSINDIVKVELDTRMPSKFLENLSHTLFMASTEVLRSGWIPGVKEREEFLTIKTFVKQRTDSLGTGHKA